MWRVWTGNYISPLYCSRDKMAAIFQTTFSNGLVSENAWIMIKISLKFFPWGPINNISALVQIMAWRCPGDKPLSEPMLVSLPTHICVTRPQWVKQLNNLSSHNTWGMWLHLKHVFVLLLQTENGNKDRLHHIVVFDSWHTDKSGHGAIIICVK